MTLALNTQFRDPGPLVDGDLRLVLQHCCPADPLRGLAAMYRFVMTPARGGPAMGNIELRLGDTDYLRLYAGHVGYGVEPPYRGHHYAARSLRLILPLAQAHGLRPLWITTNPDNWASRRACELAGAEMVGIVDVPPGCDIYRRGERQKCRYRII